MSLLIYVLYNLEKTNKNVFHWFSICSLLLMGERLSDITHGPWTIAEHSRPFSLYTISSLEDSCHLAGLIVTSLSHWKSQARTQRLSQKILFHAHTKSAAVSNTFPKQRPAQSDSEIQVASIWGFSMLTRGLQNYSNWGKENWRVTHWVPNALLITADPTFGRQGPVS